MVKAGYELLVAMRSKRGSELQQVTLESFLALDVVYVGGFTLWCLRNHYWFRKWEI